MDGDEPAYVSTVYARMRVQEGLSPVMAKMHPLLRRSYEK